MKICLINNLYAPYDRGGGAERITEIIASGLKKQGHEVFVISTKPLFGNKRKLTDKNHYLPSLFFHLNKLPKSLRLIWHIFDTFHIGKYIKIKKILTKEKPDFVMTHNLKGLGSLTPLAIKRAGIKHVHEIHDIQLLHPSGLMYFEQENILDSLCARLYSRICAFLFASPDIVVSPSEWLLKLHRKKNFFANSKITVLENPVIINIDKPRQETNKTPIFLYAGQIDRHKGFPFLIKAWQKISQPAKLVIIGAGNKLAESKKIAKNNENIEFLGYQNNQIVKDWMKKADCLVLPSICYENSPTVIYEAVSLGLPVLGSRLAGIEELINKLGGWLFAPGNEKDLLEKINFILDNREEVKKIATNGVLKITQYSREEYLNKIITLIKNN